VGKMEISVVFRTEKNRQIVGGRVIEGLAERTASLEIIRGGEKIGEGKIIEIQVNKKALILLKRAKSALFFIRARKE